MTREPSSIESAGDSRPRAEVEPGHQSHGDTPRASDPTKREMIFVAGFDRVFSKVTTGFATINGRIDQAERRRAVKAKLDFDTFDIRLEFVAEQDAALALQLLEPLAAAIVRDDLSVRAVIHEPKRQTSDLQIAVRIRQILFDAAVDPKDMRVTQARAISTDPDWYRLELPRGSTDGSEADASKAGSIRLLTQQDSENDPLLPSGARWKRIRTGWFAGFGLVLGLWWVLLSGAVFLRSDDWFTPWALPGIFLVALFGTLFVPDGQLDTTTGSSGRDRGFWTPRRRRIAFAAFLLILLVLAYVGGLRLGAATPNERPLDRLRSLGLAAGGFGAIALALLVVRRAKTRSTFWIASATFLGSILGGFATVNRGLIAIFEAAVGVPIGSSGVSVFQLLSAARAETTVFVLAVVGALLAVATLPRGTHRVAVVSSAIRLFISVLLLVMLCLPLLIRVATIGELLRRGDTAGVGFAACVNPVSSSRDSGDGPLVFIGSTSGPSVLLALEPTQDRPQKQDDDQEEEPLPEASYRLVGGQVEVETVSLARDQRCYVGTQPSG